MDEDDDAVNFLGGARGSIPPSLEDDLGDSPVFVPGWGYQVNNPGRDLSSCRDYVQHAMPPVLKEKMDSLSVRQSINRGYKNAFDAFMWDINTLKVAERVDKLNRKLGLALKEDRAKAKATESLFAAEREGFEKFKAGHAEEIARVDQMVSEIESLKTKLAEQAKRSEDMETALQLNGQELNAAHLERDEALSAKDRLTAERDQAIFERDAAVEEKRKLQAGLPELIITSMGCPGIKNPFANFVKCARAQGQHEVALLATQHLSPLPEAIAAKLDPEVFNRGREAGQALASLTTSPFLEKLVEDLDMPVDSILALKP